MAEQSVTSVTYGSAEWGRGAAALGGRGVGEGCGSTEWGRGAVQSRAELRTNNSELELSVEDLSYMYVYEIYVLHACLISFVSL